MRRVQQGYTPITDFGGKKQVNFDALFSSDSEEETVKAPPSPVQPYQPSDDPISVWTQKVVESFEKASEGKKNLSPDFKESLGRLSFFRRPLPVKENLVTKEKTSSSSVDTQ
jgi:hypothetical protein